MTGQRFARLFVMFASWGAIGAMLAYAFGIRRVDLLVVCGLVAVAVALAISGVLFLLAGDRSPPPRT